LRLATDEQEAAYNSRVLENVWPEVLERERKVQKARQDPSIESAGERKR
jgi:hypothetical protein